MLRQGMDKMETERSNMEHTRIRKGATILRAALLGGAMLSAASCGGQPHKQTVSQSAPTVAPATSAQTTPIPQLAERASLCGRSLGVAVRCNMVNDQNDFAILRDRALNGLHEQAPGASNFTPVENAFDVAALDMINSVGACKGAATGMVTLKEKIEGTIAQCAKTNP
jgi:hypothetical protein